MNFSSHASRWRALALLSFLLAVPGLPAPASGAAPPMDTVRAEAERGGYRLIATGDLAALYADADRDLLLVDTRQGWEYRAGHIAKAVSFPMEPTWWERLTSRRALRKVLGPDREKILVFYSAGLA